MTAAARAARPGAVDAAAVWPDRAARFYAEGLDRSDYAGAAATALRATLGLPASLLDIGAGAGHPVACWLPPASRWTAVEPNRYLRARLGRLRRTTHPGLHPVDAVWEALPGLDLPPHEVALAANIGGPLSAPRPLLTLMRACATRAVAWILPAQRGPRRWCLAGALPASLHGEDERPGVLSVLDALGAAPDRHVLFSWTFRARSDDAAAAEAHCATQLGLPARDPRRVALRAHLTAAFRPVADGGVELAAPKRSALLIWDLA